jgi:perosamine synthetase
MSTSLPEFCVPQEPFLSASFLSVRASPASTPRLPEASRRYLFFFARNAIYHVLRLAKIAPGEEVLVPAYVCKVVPEAIRGYGGTVVYYAVDRECRPDFSDLEKKLSSRTRALMAVHFFGFPQPIVCFQQFCKRHNLFLVEDCCHVLQSEVNGVPLGRFGDASLFSFRKFYPLYDGGELVLNIPGSEFDVDWRRESPLFTFREAVDLIDQTAGRNAKSILHQPYRLLQSLRRPIAQLLRSATTSSSGSMAVQKTDATFDLGLVNQPMSRLSKLVLGHSNASAIAAQRRANYIFLQNELPRRDGLRFLVPALPEGVCPWVFPLFFDQLPDACQVLRSEGIPAVTWEGVRPLDVDLRLFENLELLYKNLVFLPIHQNLSAQDMSLILQAVKRVQESRNHR